ncbi:hypothetical protein SAMN03097699_2411 [Flavobacteriaceae bacterium MAR_2010_188]|nr:hypothetical protein SAMN03097699_2411 [Flavobacteriaceae bacterium MAR_2010_188]
MKIAIIIISILALGLIVYNATLIDWNNPLSKDSTVAIITIVASLCAIMLLQILRISKKIQVLDKKRR